MLRSRKIHKAEDYADAVRLAEECNVSERSNRVEWWPEPSSYYWESDPPEVNADTHWIVTPRVASADGHLFSPYAYALERRRRWMQRLALGVLILEMFACIPLLFLAVLSAAEVVLGLDLGLDDPEDFSWTWVFSAGVAVGASLLLYEFANDETPAFKRRSAREAMGANEYHALQREMRDKMDAT